MFSINLSLGGPPLRTDKALQLRETMLTLAQELFLEELATDSLFACGNGYTSKLAGQYGLYETLDGHVMSFQPKPHITFTLISEEFVASGDLATITALAYHVNEYDLSAQR